MGRVSIRLTAIDARKALTHKSTAHRKSEGENKRKHPHGKVLYSDLHCLGYLARLVSF